jgi:hypothetical protein
MTMIAFVLVLAGLVSLLALVGRFGADSRRTDPRCVEPQWPFAPPPQPSRRS